MTARDDEPKYPPIIWFLLFLIVAGGCIAISSSSTNSGTPSPVSSPGYDPGPTVNASPETPSLSPADEGRKLADDQKAAVDAYREQSAKNLGMTVEQMDSERSRLEAITSRQLEISTETSQHPEEADRLMQESNRLQAEAVVLERDITVGKNR